MDGNLPLHFLQNSTGWSRASRVHVQFHDIWFTGFEKPDQVYCQGPKTGWQGVQAQWRAGTHLHGQEQPRRGTGIRPIGKDHFCRPSGQETHDLGNIQVLSSPLQAKRRHGFRWPPIANEYSLPGFSGDTGKIPEEVRLHTRGRVPGHELFAVSYYQETGRTA